jgi:hypothetical protein
MPTHALSIGSSTTKGAPRSVLQVRTAMVAGRLGVTPQSLSRAFAALRSLGVTGSGGEVPITDPARLRKFTAMRALDVSTRR